MKIALTSFVSLGTLLGLSATSFAVPFTVDPAPDKVLIEKSLNAGGYGFTSHEGQQQIFEDFRLSEGTEINMIAWYGLFSEGTVANNQSTGSFNVFFFSSNSDSKYLETIPIPEGTIVGGLPDEPALYAATSTDVLGVGTGQTDPLQGGDIKKWTMDLSALSLAAGDYFVSIRANSSEPGYFLWNHSESGADGYSVHGSISPSNKPSFIVSAERYDTQAFSLERVTSSSKHQVPDNGPGIAALLTVLGLLVASGQSMPRSRVSFPIFPAPRSSLMPVDPL